MGVFDKSNYIVNTGITEQFFQCTTKMILFAKMMPEEALTSFTVSNAYR